MAVHTGMVSVRCSVEESLGDLAGRADHSAGRQSRVVAEVGHMLLLRVSRGKNGGGFLCPEVHVSIMLYTENMSRDSIKILFHWLDLSI